MARQDLEFASRLAKIFARLRWSSPLNPLKINGVEVKALSPVVFLSENKLKHDIEQLEYLIENKVCSFDLESLRCDYKETMSALDTSQPDEHVELDKTSSDEVKSLFNKVINVRNSQRVEQVFAKSWSAQDVESRYLTHQPGIVVIDNFLSKPVLEELKLFCLESTIWSANRYPYGRLGAFFREGFNSPLLCQIAEELRSTLPNVIGEKHPLRQMWGFKNSESVPEHSSIHADFAAVNVNFWITPSDANLDENSGGMTIYEADAPADWDFAAYNANPGLIRSHLRQVQAKSLRIPYRENRAIIFNSDLFHETDAVNFKPGFENRRINITMLYGNRENDIHHQPFQWSPGPSGQRSSWKSASFSRTRRSR